MAGDLLIKGVGLPSIGPAPVGAKSQGKPASFLDTLSGAVREVEASGAKADRSMTDLAVGRRKTLHETMIAVEEAEIKFRLMMAVRGKLINAYHEIMRMNF